MNQPLPPPNDGSHAPEVSVVIVNYNGQRHLPACLGALRATQGVAFETLLVDNASSDGSADWVAQHHPWVQVLRLPRNLGFGGANHVGIAHARAPLVALLNNDTVVEPQWLAVLKRTLEREPEAVAACATLELLHHPGLYNARGGGMTWLGYGYDRDFGRPRLAASELPEVEEVLFPTAAAALFRKGPFLALGGFDPSFFMYHEDVDFGWRAWIAGWKVVVCRDAVVKHAFGGTTSWVGGDAMRYRLGSRHLLRSLLKCMELRLLPKTLFNLAKIWFRQRAFGLLASVTLWNLWHLPGTLLARVSIQRNRRRSFAELQARGLVAEAPFPPEPPMLPCPVAEEALVPSPVLFPGKDSARGRLGYGWYAHRNPKGEPERLTTGRASFRLRVAPGARGTLSLRLRRPVADRPQVPLQLAVNGATHHLELPGTDQATVAVSASADEEGMLRVELAVPEVVPHHVLGNWQFAPVGVAVAEVRFLPEKKPRENHRPTVSVVIPTFNRWGVLRETLEALARQTVKPLEVVVVDDGSSDGTWENLQAWQRANEPRLRLVALRQDNAGPAKARNAGLTKARAELVVFIGDDTIPEADFLQAHLEAHRCLEGACAVVGLTEWDGERMRVTPFLEHVNLSGEQFAYGLFHHGEDMAFTCLYTSNLSVPRQLLGEKPFHEGFRHAAWEDAELGYRLSLRGVRIVLWTKARTRHLHPMDLAGFLRRQEKVGETLPLLLQRHPELAGDPAIPPRRPPRLLRLLFPLAGPLSPLANALDHHGVRLPPRCYRLLLLAATYRGRRRGEG